MDIVRNNGTAIHMQIALNILAQIEQGYLLPGVALPGSRELSQKLKVNRKTVIQAYDELIAQGWLTAQYKRGTFVSPRSIEKKSAKLSLAPASELASQYNPPINQHNLVQNIVSTEFANFTVDLPDERLAPLKAITSALRHALSSNEKSSAHNDDPLGTTALRQAILQMVNMERNFGAQLVQTCVVHSDRMAIFLAARAVIQAGDIIVVDELTSQSTHEIFKSCDAVMLNLGRNSQGIDLTALNAHCLLHKVRAVYVKPRCHIAQGNSMSLAHKKQLLNLSIKFNFLIIEDDQDAEFDDAQQSSFPIASLAQDQQVIYIGSFSKMLPSLITTAYIVASPSIVQKCGNHMHLLDCKGNKVIELAMTELLNSGEFKRYISRVKKIYAERLKLMRTLIEQELADVADFVSSCMGFNIWLNINTPLNLQLFLNDASEFGLKLNPSQCITNAKNQVNCLRLGYGHLNKEEMAAGIKLLSNVIHRQTKQKLTA